MQESRQQYLEDKALVIAIAELQSRPINRQPISDINNMCEILRSKMNPQYLAVLAFELEVSGGQVNLFADLELDSSEWLQSDLEYAIDFDTTILAMKEGVQRSKELLESGADDGSNVIDFSAYKRRRSLAA